MEHNYDTIIYTGHTFELLLTSPTRSEWSVKVGSSEMLFFKNGCSYSG